MAFIEYLSVPALLLAWLLHMIIRAVWYSHAMFGSDVQKITKPRHARPPSNTDAYIALAVGTVMYIPPFLFCLTKAGCETWHEGALWGLAFGLFDLGMNAAHSFFENRSFLLNLIHRGYHTVSLTLIGAILPLLCAPSF